MRRIRAKFLYELVDQRAARTSAPMLSVSIHHGVVPREAASGHSDDSEALAQYKVCEAGDVVLNRMRAFQGAVGISAMRGLVSPDYLVLRPRSDISPRFLFYLLKSPWFVGEMVSRLRGIGGTESGAVRTPRVNGSDLGDIEVGVPKYDEQERIAEFLDSRLRVALSLRKSLVAAIDTLGRRVQALVDNALDLSDLEIVPLKVIADVVDTEHKTAPYVPGGGYWVAGTSSLRQGKIVLDQLLETDYKAYLEWTRRGTPTPGDVLYSREAPVGEVGIYREDDPPIAIGQRTVLLRPSIDKCEGQFLVWNLMSSRTRRYIDDQTQGSLHPHLNIPQIKSIPIVKASPSQQLELAERLSTAVRDTWKIAEMRSRQLALLNQRRDALINSAVPNIPHENEGRAR